MSIDDELCDSVSVSSTVPRSIFGLFDGPADPIPVVTMGSVSNFDPSDCVGIISRPNDIVGGVSPDSSHNPTGSAMGLRDRERGGIGGRVSP